MVNLFVYLNSPCVFFFTSYSVLQLWERFFKLAIDFCCQPYLQLEIMTELKKNRVLDVYGDMRMTATCLVLQKWRALG